MPSSSFFVWATQSSESLLDLKNSTQQQCLFSRNHDPVTPENPQTFYVATIFILQSESCKQKKHSDSWGTPLRVSSCTCHEHVMATMGFCFFLCHVHNPHPFSFYPIQGHKGTLAVIGWDVTACLWWGPTHTQIISNHQLAGTWREPCLGEHASSTQPVNSNPRLPRCEGAVLNSALSSHPHPFFFISHQNNLL